MDRIVTALAAVVVASAAIMAPALAQNHPDLSGLWADGIVPGQGSSDGGPDHRPFVAVEQDTLLRRNGSIDRPPYKAEFWDAVRDHAVYATIGGEWIGFADPVWRGMPPGVPRLGPPSKIIQTQDFITLLYAQNNIFRDIPIDCRPHNEAMARDISYMGYAIGCWEGDTLVLTSKGFTDETWLDAPGYIHSAQMEVIETLRRDGDALFYDVTVIDPVMFDRPWMQATRVLTLDTRQGAILPEAPPAIDRSALR